jgi:V/A-type H+-transporting ATPase subunit E
VERSSSAKSTLDKVASEFSDEIQADLEDGKKQALENLRKVQKETDAALAKIMETSARQADSLRRQIVGSAELESRNMLLRALEDSVNEVFASALARLSKVSPSAREKSLTSLIQDGVNAIGEHAKVACSEKDKDVVSGVIKKMNSGTTRLALDDKSIDALGGVVLTSPDGTVKFDNTFEARLERSKPLLRKQVAELLTGGRQ